jgi:cellulose synthase/poly-beta-1,6-N-acetylglucosamine synthase-like glycosyltransferase
MPALALSTRPRKKLALVIPGRNEELAIGMTIRLAIRSGQPKADIYVVSDASTDKTYDIAVSMLGKSNVLQVKPSGKSGAVNKAIKKFDIVKKYQWMHISDADGVFGPDYFRIFRSSLSERNVAATGYVMSLQGALIPKYRVYEYVFGLSLIRRVQSWLGVITVIPGPTSCLRTDIIKQLDFETGSMTEDFDITLQIHRKKLGRIQFIPKAKTYTQDPATVREYVKQITRWYRGFFQGVVTHKLGRRAQKIDVFLGALMLQTIVYGVELVLLPLYVLFVTHDPTPLAAFFLAEVGLYAIVFIGCALVAKRIDIMVIFPLFYVVRLINMWVFFKTGFEVLVLKKYRGKTVGWVSPKRYALATSGIK